MGESELVLPAEAAAAATARRFVASWLATRHLESLLDTVVLLTSEVVTNALLHVTGPARMVLTPVDGGVRVEVSDSSAAGPAQRRRNPEAATGRGLLLLDDLSDAWGWAPAPGGKTVWFTVTTAADPWGAFTGTDWHAQAEA